MNKEAFFCFKFHPRKDEIDNIIFTGFNIPLMELAIKLRYPPVDGIQHILVKEFPDLIGDRKTRSYVGYTIKQHFLNKGFKVDKVNCRCRNPLFVKNSTRFKSR